MANIAIDTDAVDGGPEWGITTGGQPIPVTASQSFVTINGVPIVKAGDAVDEHYDWGVFNTIVATHSGATMTSSQSFAKINGTNIVVNNDSSTCDPTHVIVGTGFVTIS